MASFEEHCRDCERLLGDRCEPVNRWLDAMFRQYREQHRFVRHHWRGVREAEALFGVPGRKAAIIHILKDCGFVPKDRDWKEGKVDSLGMDRTKVFNGYWDPAAFLVAARKLLVADSAPTRPGHDEAPVQEEKG